MSRYAPNLPNCWEDEISFKELIAVEGIWSDPQGEWVQKTFGFVEEVTGVLPEARGATYFTDGPLLSRASGESAHHHTGPRRSDHGAPD